MKDQEKQEVFRGHVDECIKHFSAQLEGLAPKGSKGITKLRQPIANFTGVQVHAVRRWFYDGKLPLGEVYIKLLCFLDLSGYRVLELERMKHPYRKLAELIGYGILSSEEARGLLQFRASRSQGIFEILRGKRGVSEEKERKMYDIWKERKEELEQKKKKSQELYCLDILLKVRPKAEEAKPVVLLSRQAAAVSIMEGLLALLEEGSFEKLSERGLTDLKRSADTVLRLSAHLSNLSAKLVMPERRKGGSSR